MRVHQITFNDRRSIRMGHLQADTSQIKSVGIGNQPSCNLRFIRIANLIGDHFPIGIHRDSGIVLNLHTIRQREAMPAPVRHGIEGDKCLQSGNIHAKSKIAVTYLCRASVINRIGHNPMTLYNGTAINFSGLIAGDNRQ